MTRTTFDITGSFTNKEARDAEYQAYLEEDNYFKCDCCDDEHHNDLKIDLDEGVYCSDCIDNFKADPKKLIENYDLNFNDSRWLEYEEMGIEVLQHFETPRDFSERLDFVEECHSLEQLIKAWLDKRLGNSDVLTTISAKIKERKKRTLLFMAKAA